MNSIRNWITTPIFYVNAAPHIGHAYSMVLADAWCRWQNRHGVIAQLSTGTDEHGLKIQQQAQLAKEDPQLFCDKMSVQFKNLAHHLTLNNPIFIRTTEPRHKLAVTTFWNALMKSGHLQQGEHAGWYSIADETFYTATQIHTTSDNQTVSKESGRPVHWITETNYKFHLEAYRPRLRDWLRQVPLFPETRRSELMTWVDQPLPDLSLSRWKQRCHWGIQVPQDPEQTVYVWLDALVNYLTVTGYGTSWQTVEEAPSVSFTHVIGQDITKFHTIYWPAFLMAAQLPLPKALIIHSHWTRNAQKMSKSSGNGFLLHDTFFTHPSVSWALRFYLLHSGGMQKNQEFEMERISGLYDSILRDGLGNLVSRITAPRLVSKTEWLVDEDKKMFQWGALNLVEKESEIFMEQMKRLEMDVIHHFDQCQFGQGLQIWVQMVGIIQRYLTQSAPWSKQLTKDQVGSCLFHTAEALRIVAKLLEPIVPSLSERVLFQLGDSNGWAHFSDILVPRISLIPESLKNDDHQNVA